MSRVAVLVAILSLLASVHTTEARSDAAQHGLKGRVKQVVTERADFSDHAGEWTQMPNVGVSTERYDPEGWIIQSDQYDPRIAPHSYTTVTRQPDGSIISETRSLAKDGILLGSSTTTFDGKRKQTAASGFNADGSMQWNDVVSRTSLGEAIQERVGGNGLLLYRGFWFDGPGGSRIADITNYQEGTPVSQSRQVYNQRGQFISSEGYDQNGRGHRVVLDYREDGQPNTETTYDADGRLSSQRTYFYDGDGHKNGATQFSYHADGRPPSKVVYTYGPNNLMTSMTHTTSGFAAGLQISYEFDEQGNWIRQTTSHCLSGRDEFGASRQDPRTCEVLIRTITYYDPVEEPLAGSSTHEERRTEEGPPAKR